MTQSFKVFGKWILLGEHSVVRGSPALVFPLFTNFLELIVSPSNSLAVHAENAILQSAFKNALLEAEKFLKKDGRKIPNAKLQIQSNQVISAGLGSSATICTAIARWLESEKIIQAEELFTISLEMENFFHGTSSGLDLAATIYAKPLKFIKNKPVEPLIINWNPKIYLFDTGIRSSTSECVKKVCDLNDPSIDEKMHQAVLIAETALTHMNEPEGMLKLIDAINLGLECFQRWELIPEIVQKQMELLKNEGAIAVKPTGSGNGGFILSLWGTPPPAHLNLIPTFYAEGKNEK